jgi:hypothetical protein
MIAEPAKAAQIDLGRSPLVPVFEKIGCNAIHLIAQPSAAKTPKHLRIFVIKLQHSRLSVGSIQENPEPDEETDG